MSAEKIMKASGVEPFSPIFPKVKSRFDQRHGGHGLLCKQGSYDKCLVLKLQKAAWTNDRMDQLKNETGIFFSIWMDEKVASQSRALYNIHALKLRQLTGYSITSRDFASDFRKGFAAMRDLWPNVSVDYGPLTLMQGWIEFNPKSLEKDLLILMECFRKLSPLIDRLLIDRLLKSRRNFTSALPSAK